MDDDNPTLFNTATKALDPYWIDPKQPLMIPVNPLHWKAHQLQEIIEMLKTQAKKSPAQFNSKNLIDALNEFEKCVTLINKGAFTDENADQSGMVENGNSNTTPPLGERTPVGSGRSNISRQSFYQVKG